MFGLKHVFLKATTRYDCISVDRGIGPKANPILVCIHPSNLTSVNVTMTVVGDTTDDVATSFHSSLSSAAIGIHKPHSSPVFEVVFLSPLLSFHCPRPLQRRSYHQSLHFYAMVRRSSWYTLFGPRHAKTFLCHMRTTKVQISLRIRAV